MIVGIPRYHDRMNRTDRLYALVEELRARAPRTAPAVALAQHFEVSTRTIERDVLALQEAGVPIWAQPGPGGGYGINVDTTLPPLNLTPAEAAALATPLAALGVMPLAGAGRSALKKLTAVMASASRDTAAQLLTQIRVVQEPQSPAAAVSDVVQRALIASVAVELIYRDAQGCETARIVELAGIFGTHNGWYLAAWCRLRQAPRAFRLDRIAQATLTREPITPRSLDAVLADIPVDMVQPALM